MKVSVEKLPSSEAVLEVDFTWDELEKASDKAFRKLVQQVDIQGFRRGKAPRSLVERRLGKEYIYQEGLDELISEAYRDTLKEHELTPISQPKLDAPEFEMGQPYHVKLTVPIVTPVELGDYRSLHFDREEVLITSEEVDKELESLRNSVATWDEVERPADYEDRVTMDLLLVSGEQQISDLKDNPFTLTKERTGLFTGLDENIVGMKAGESKEFTTTIPEDYSNEKYAGKEGSYTVTLHKIEERQLPELDDAFAEKVSEGQYESVETLSKVLSDNILERKKRATRDELREEAIKAVIDQSTFTIHPLLIDEEIEEMEHQFSHMLEQQRLSFDQYLMMTRKSREEYRQELRPDAEGRVKRQLVLDEIARQEEIAVQADELEALFNAYAQAGQELPRTETQVRYLALSYRREKALTRLVELTTDPDPDEESEIDASIEAQEQDQASEELAEAAAGVEAVEGAEEKSQDVLSHEDNSSIETDTSEPSTGKSSAQAVE